jgi:hypothetical protein
MLADAAIAAWLAKGNQAAELVISDPYVVALPPLPATLTRLVCMLLHVQRAVGLSVDCLRTLCGLYFFNIFHKFRRTRFGNSKRLQPQTAENDTVSQLLFWRHCACACRRGGVRRRHCRQRAQHYARLASRPIHGAGHGWFFAATVADRAALQQWYGPEPVNATPAAAAHILNKLGVHVARADLDAIVASVDLDMDGTVSVTDAAYGAMYLAAAATDAAIARGLERSAAGMALCRVFAAVTAEGAADSVAVEGAVSSSARVRTPSPLRSPV